MKYISTLVVVLTLFCGLQCHSQTLINSYSNEDHLITRRNSKGLSLKIEDLRTVEKNGKTSWMVRTTLTNRSRDTVFYFITPDCESANFMAMPMTETVSLFADFEPCGVDRQTVIALPPKGKRIVDVMFSSHVPVKSSFKFMAFLLLHKAENRDERIPHDVLIRKKDREIFLQSNKIKVEIPEDKSKSG